MPVCARHLAFVSITSFDKQSHSRAALGPSTSITPHKWLARNQCLELRTSLFSKAGHDLRGEKSLRKSCHGGRSYTCVASLQALVFDCDGVILESEDLHRRAYNAAFIHFNVVCPGSSQPLEWTSHFYDQLQNQIGGGKPKMRWFILSLSLRHTHTCMQMPTFDSRAMASSAALEQEREKEFTQTDYWWQQVDILNKYDSKRGGAKKFRCRYCGVERGGAPDRVKAHLLGLEGFGIAKCTKVPSMEIERMEQEVAGLPFPSKRKASAPIVATSSAPLASATMPRSTSAGSGVSATSSPAFLPFQQPAKKKQHTLHTSWHPQRKAQVDAAVARFFYSCGISFNVANSEFFKEMVTEIASFGPTYMPPNYNALKEKLLEQEVTSINEAMLPVKEKWRVYGVSLMGDGWTDTRSRPLEGIVAACRGKSLYVKSTESGVRQKTAPVLVEMWSEAMEYVGPNNVIQFVSDLESTNKAAGSLLEDKYPHVFWSPCMAHCLNNFLKDIGKLAWVKSTFDTGKEVITFITRHHYSLALYRRYAKKELLKYSDTRFAYNFLMMRRLYTMRPYLKQMVASPDWASWPTSRSALGRLCFDTILQEDFWPDVEHIILLCLPIVKLLRLVDGDVPYIGKIYEAMDRMIEHIRVIETDKEKLEEVEELAISRWNQYSSPLHAAAYVLDPEFEHKGAQVRSDAEITRGWNTTLQRLIVTNEERRKIKDQLAKYRNKEGIFSWHDAQLDRFRVGAVTWWEDYGADTPELQTLAIRILGQVCSSSALERLWSTFSHIHTKKRNRLGANKANDLVFVNANLRLLTKMKHEYTNDIYVGFHRSESDSRSLTEAAVEESDEEHDEAQEDENANDSFGAEYEDVEEAENEDFIA